MNSEHHSEHCILWHFKSLFRKTLYPISKSIPQSQGKGSDTSSLQQM